MSITKKSSIPRRTRRSPEAARDNILAAAQALLLEKGPQALKLTDVAARAGIAHATVLHHFGTIADVHTALMERMIRDLVGQIQAAHAKSGKGGVEDEKRPATGAPLLFAQLFQFVPRSTAIVARKGSGITKVEDLVGRTVAANRSGGTPGPDTATGASGASNRWLFSTARSSESAASACRASSA
mgnify:CR=1 FL=1